MKAVMISIRPQWCEKIASGEKTLELRKSFPKLKRPFKCYIYCTKRPPYLVLGDVFRGNWETEYTTTHGYSREEADRIWGTMNGKVIGEFVCDKISTYPYVEDDSDPGVWRYEISTSEGEKTCLKYDDFAAYGKGQTLYGWHISELKIYDKPKDISEFFVWKKCNSCRASGYETTACGYDEDCKVPAMITKAPQSWCYIEENTDE